MAEPVDAAFIRRAVTLADLDAVRVALYQQTHHPDLAALPLAAQMSDAERQALVDAATAWLTENASPVMPPEPTPDDLRMLMNMATDEEMGDLEFESRRRIPAFEPFARSPEWTDGRPPIPDGFLVVVIGSGFSGIAMGVQLERLGIPYVVLERRHEPGGTWSVHRYPDIRVDTASNTFEYSFEQRYPWRQYYAPGAQVREYLEHVSRKYGVYEHTRFNCDVRRAVFDEAENIWSLEVETPAGREELRANVLVSAAGTFATPREPSFEGIESFEGRVVHPSRWPDDLELDDKAVAVIGNGSSGVQLLAPVARVASQVFVFQRTPQWMARRINYREPVEPEVRWLIDNFPGYWNWLRYMLCAPLFRSHGLLTQDPAWQAEGGRFNPMNDELRRNLTAYIVEQTAADPSLTEKLIPDYAPFSRRLVVDNDWYRTLTLPHVELVTDEIARMTPRGIVTCDGTEREVDVVIAAIGFEVVRYLWPADYIGRGGTSIHDAWRADGPRAYIGMMVPDFPNLFTIYGPNSQPLSGGTGMPMWYMTWAEYVARCVVRLLEEGRSTVEVTHEAFDRYNDALDAEAQELLLLDDEGAPDKNYYVNQGRLQTNAPWYGPEYHRLSTEIAWDDLAFDAGGRDDGAYGHRRTA